MKKFVFSTVLAFALLFAGSSQAQEFKFKKTQHDFGEIEMTKGEVEYRFEFKNAGKMPLSIFKVTTSCGCTAPEWSKKPVLPGKTGYVTVTFDTKDGKGNFLKTININSNADPNFELKISGTVI